MNKGKNINVIGGIYQVRDSDILAAKKHTVSSIFERDANKLKPGDLLLLEEFGEVGAVYSKLDIIEEHFKVYANTGIVQTLRVQFDSEADSTTLILPQREFGHHVVTLVGFPLAEFIENCGRQEGAKLFLPQRVVATENTAFALNDLDELAGDWTINNQDAQAIQTLLHSHVAWASRHNAGAYITPFDMNEIDPLTFGWSVLMVDPFTQFSIIAVENIYVDQTMYAAFVHGSPAGSLICYGLDSNPTVAMVKALLKTPARIESLKNPSTRKVSLNGYDTTDFKSEQINWTIDRQSDGSFMLDFNCKFGPLFQFQLSRAEVTTLAQQLIAELGKGNGRDQLPDPAHLITASS